MTQTMLNLASPQPPTIDRDLDAVLRRLHDLHPKVIDLSLERVLRLLDRLDRPQNCVPPVVHVAGTNGKGSVIAYLRTILEAAGYSAHVFTSPHLVRFNERYRVAGRLIDSGELASLLLECETANAGAPITFFEIITAAAFLAFSRTPADVTLLETGLGGRLDATNVVERPALTVITPVSMDHMSFLGDTIRQIAAEKAAIQKPEVPSVVAPQLDPVMEVILAQAETVGARPYSHKRNWTVQATPRGMIYRSTRMSLHLPRPALSGIHQIVNAATAVACLEQLDGLEVTDKAIGEGLKAAEWPARLQRLLKGRLAETLPHGWELWLDGGHNAGAGAALAEMARPWRDKPLYLVFGMMERKEPENFLRPIARWVRHLRAVAIPGHEGSLTAEQAATAARDVGIRAVAAADVASAIADLLERERGPARILICGSLYLAGAVLAENEGVRPPDRD